MFPRYVSLLWSPSWAGDARCWDLPDKLIAVRYIIHASLVKSSSLPLISPTNLQAASLARPLSGGWFSVLSGRAVYNNHSFTVSENRIKARFSGLTQELDPFFMINALSRQIQSYYFLLVCLSFNMLALCLSIICILKPLKITLQDQGT